MFNNTKRTHTKERCASLPSEIPNPVCGLTATLELSHFQISGTCSGLYCNNSGWRSLQQFQSIDVCQYRLLVISPALWKLARNIQWAWNCTFHWYINDVLGTHKQTLISRLQSFRSQAISHKVVMSHAIWISNIARIHVIRPNLSIGITSNFATSPIVVNVGDSLTTKKNFNSGNLT
jgi:hypothetical protein